MTPGTQPTFVTTMTADIELAPPSRGICPTEAGTIVFKDERGQSVTGKAIAGMQIPCLMTQIVLTGTTLKNFWIIR
jgi:hypothetical protein